MKKLIVIVLFAIGFSFTQQTPKANAYFQTPQDTIKSSAGGLTKEEGNFLPFGSFRCFQTAANKVQLYATGNNIQYWLITTPVVLDSVTYNTPAEFIEKVASFKRGGGSGTGAVNSVTGSLVSGTSANPVVNNPLLEFHRVIIPELGTRTITDFNGNITLVTNGVDPASTFTLEWGAITDETRKITILCTFDASLITHVALDGVIISRLPTSAKVGDVWEVVYDKFYNIWAVVSTSSVGTDRQVSGYLNGIEQPTIINVEHLTDIGGYPSFTNGVLTATAMNATTKTGLLSFIEFSTTTPKVGTFPSYGTGGVLPVNSGTASGHAVNVGQGFNFINATISRSFALSDAGLAKMVRCYGVVLNLTIPADATVNFPVGSVINVCIISSTVTLVAASGVDLLSDTTDFIFSGKKNIRIIKTAANQWVAGS